MAATPSASCHPDHLAVLVLTGPDARGFLNGQCTQSVVDLAPGADTPAAIMTPQGRVLAYVHIHGTATGLRLLLPADLIEAVRNHLSRYVLRAKVQLTIDAPSTADVETARAARAATGAEQWHLGSIRLGEPEISAATSGEWIAQMLNLDLLGAIRFDKGCYTGQEIVARTQHLGRIKRRLFRLTLNGPAPAPLDSLFDGETKVGEVVLAATATQQDAECLAVISLEAKDRPLTLGDGRLCRVAPLPYSMIEPG
jgi:folate-binding protein YgfZ